MERVCSKPIAALDTPLPSAREPLPSDELRTRSTALAAALAPLPLDQRLHLMRREVRGPIVFTTSFGLEDQVILHALRQHQIDVEIVTLDTGRLFPETHDVWMESEQRYGIRIRSIYPPRKGSTASFIRGTRAWRAATFARSSRSIARSPAPRPGSPA
jgi:phosphoadenosine phosphosulfate reductase